MEFDPRFYNDFTDSILPATKLINRVNGINKNNNRFGGLILDIGCGTGSTTKLLNKIDCDRIIGCDIDPKMINFAQKYNLTQNTEYIVQDFGAKWNQFDERLKEIAGKVSIVFTNYAMAWIWDKESAAYNISKLLSSNGILVANILYDGDIFQQLSASERKKAFELVPYPTEQEFIGGWIMALKNANLSKMEIDYWEPKILMSEKLYTDEYINIPMNWYKHYSTVNNDLNEEVDKLLKLSIFRERCRRVQHRSDKGEDQIEIVNRLWQITAVKKP